MADNSDRDSIRQRFVSSRDENKRDVEGFLASNKGTVIVLVIVGILVAGLIASFFGH